MKKNIILLIMSIVLMSILIGFSFAYFTSNSNDSSKQKISIENGNMELTYTDCVNKEDCSNISAELEPGDSISKTFSVKNTGTLDTNFKIVFSKSNNTFVDDELIYTLYNNNDNSEISNGIVPYGNKTNSYVYTESIKPVETKNYKMTITFKDIESGNNESNKEGTFNIDLGIQNTEHGLQTWNFDYTGSVQEFTAPKDGTYVLEVWGAAGQSNAGMNKGGNGGYSKGKLNLLSNQKIYVTVGSSGENKGYNGGGVNIRDTSDLTKHGNMPPGGGATSMQKVLISNGLLKDYEDNKENIIIVAGGGGGGEWHAYDFNGNTINSGGNGGGFMGSNGSNRCNNSNQTHSFYPFFGLGGTQMNGGYSITKLDIKQYDSSYNNGGAIDTFNGSFGQGGHTENGDGGGAGGGGYFGGGASNIGCGGGGGSGYIANSLLTDKHMACYNCETTPEESIKTISVNCTSENPTTDCAKVGNGYARITYLGDKQD